MITSNSIRLEASEAEESGLGWNTPVQPSAFGYLNKRKNIYNWTRKFLETD
jgi:hypothetical protein